MWFSIKPVGKEIIRLRVAGNLDLATTRELEPTLDRLVGRRPWHVAVELSRLTMIDSIGLRALLRFSKRLNARGCSVAVTGLRDQPLALFRLLGLDRRLGRLHPQPSVS